MMDPTYYNLQRDHRVDVTCINDPHDFYVRSIALAPYMPLIEQPSSIRVTAGTVGQRVVYLSKSLQRYVRGRICFVNALFSYDIFAIDYGYLDKSVLWIYVNLPSPKSAPENEWPGMAVHCRLGLCEPKDDMAFNQVTIGTMKYYIGPNPVTITVKNKINEQLVVELRTANCARDLGMMLALLDLTRFVSVHNNVYRGCVTTSLDLNLMKVLRYKPKQLNVGDILHVRVLSGNCVNNFFVCDVADFKSLKNAEAGFSYYVKDKYMKPSDIFPGIPCAVKLDVVDTYQRAIVKKVNSNCRAILKLVDTGKIIETHFSYMRSIDSITYFAQPMAAIYCSIAADELWNVPMFFFPSYEMGIKIIKLGNNANIPHKVDIIPDNMLWF